MFGLYRNSPTIDIYFREPLRDLITTLPFGSRGRPIRRLGPNVFLCGGRAVIIRYITPREIDALARLPLERVYYLVDDDFFDLAADKSLPMDYRERLQVFADTLLPDILSVADTIVSPSPVILQKFDTKKTELLSPAYLFNCRDFAHFDGTGPMRAIFPGTRSHIKDLEAIAPALEEAFRTSDGFTLTTFLGEHGAKLLGAHPRVVHRKAQPWRLYRKTMSVERFHIALVPYADTAFNRARSINKVHDVAAFGAAGLYSDRPPSSDVIIHDENGLLLGDDPQNWADAIGPLVRNRNEARRLAVANAVTSAEAGDPARVRAFWLKRLIPEGLPGRASAEVIAKRRLG